MSVAPVQIVCLMLYALALAREFPEATAAIGKMLFMLWFYRRVFR